MRVDSVILLALVAGLGGCTQSSSAEFEVDPGDSKADQVAVRYRVEDLGTFVPTSIAATGEIAGSVIDHGQFAARRTGSVIQNFGFGGVANDVQPGGTTVGYAENGSINQEAARWDAQGRIHRLGLLPRGGDASAATGINATGLTVGYGEDSQGIHALYWDAQDNVHILPGLGGNGWTTAVNDRGTIVGAVDPVVGDLQHAAVWTSLTQVEDIGTIGDMSWAMAINNRGVVVGFVRTSSGMHGFRWTFITGMQTLRDVAGHVGCGAKDINQAGVIVGSCEKAGANTPTPRAVLWRSGTGIALNDLLTGGQGWVLEYASSINDSGLIVGSGKLNGAWHGFLLRPAP